MVAIFFREHLYQLAQMVTVLGHFFYYRNCKVSNYAKKNEEGQNKDGFSHARHQARLFYNFLSSFLALRCEVAYQ